MFLLTNYFGLKIIRIHQDPRAKNKEQRQLGLFQIVSDCFRLFQIVSGCFKLFQVVSDSRLAMLCPSKAGRVRLNTEY
jgi:hypothetical protein